MSGVADTDETSNDRANATSNDLLRPWTDAFGAPPSDRIGARDLTAAVEAALEAHFATAQVITSSPLPATFENTLVPLERGWWELWRILNIYIALTAAATDDEIGRHRRSPRPSRGVAFQRVPGRPAVVRPTEEASPRVRRPSTGKRSGCWSEISRRPSESARIFKHSWTWKIDFQVCSCELRGTGSRNCEPEQGYSQEGFAGKCGVHREQQRLSQETHQRTKTRSVRT